MPGTNDPAERPSWVDPELFPFESRFVDLDGHTIHYVDEGSGPTLLFLHGNPTWSFVYREAIVRLRDHFRCVALDFPGFGLSTARAGYAYLPEQHAEVVGQFLGALRLGGVTLVAQDWGGPVGLAAAEQRPEAFDGLVLANTWAWPVTGELHFEVASRLMGGPVGRALITRFNLMVNAMIPAGHRLRKVSDAEMDHYRAALSTPERRQGCAVLPRQITASRPFLAEVSARLDKVAGLPALILWGDKDFAFRVKERRRLEELFPNHKTVVLEGAGHFVQSDASNGFADAIQEWRLGLRGRGPAPEPEGEHPTAAQG